MHHDAFADTPPKVVHVPKGVQNHGDGCFRADMGERHPTAGDDCGDRSPHEHRKIRSTSKHQGNHLAGGRKRK